MKKLLFLIFILFSCEKDEPECWSCRLDTVRKQADIVLSSKSIRTTICDKTADEVFDYETLHSEDYIEQAIDKFGRTVNINVICDCRCTKL